MAGSRRNGTIVRKAGGSVILGSFYNVNVLAPGGIATGPAVGSTIPLQTSHGFSTSQKILHFMQSDGIFTFYGGATVQSVAADSITMSGGGFPNIFEDDLIFNMAADTSITATPAWNGNGTGIYEDIDLQVPISGQLVAANEAGAYGYFWSGTRVWELVRDPETDAIVGYEIEIAITSPVGLSGSSLPPSGDYPGQTFLLTAQGGVGSKWYVWAQDPAGVYHWEGPVIEVA